MALAEAMIVGVPTVVSFAGAMPEFAEHYKSALFYNSIDHITCASHIDLLIQNKELSELLSRNARANRLKNNNINNILNTQLDIYKKILEQ